MIKFLFSLLFSTAALHAIYSQKVYTSKHRSGADILLFETNDRFSADVLIHRVDFASQVDPSKGLWMDVKFKSQSQMSVYWCKYPSEAQCRIFFVAYRSQATRNKCFFECFKS